MSWWLWTLIVLVVVTLLFVSLGRWLQTKGNSVERHRD
jgi:hypothetical protein